MNVTTREQAEANWIWDPNHGDLRPKEWPPKRRFPCTSKNIATQQALARPGTLIHTSANSSCPRKAKKRDVRELPLVPKEFLSTRRNQDVALAPGKVKMMAEASHIENVNCLFCRKEYFK